MPEFHPEYERTDHAEADSLNALLMEAFQIGIVVDPLETQKPRMENLRPRLELFARDLNAEISFLAKTNPLQTERKILRKALERLLLELVRLQLTLERGCSENIE